MKNFPSPKTLQRSSEALLLMACLDTAEGLSHPDVQEVLNGYPKDLAVKIIQIVITSRPNLQQLLAIQKILHDHVHEPDTENVLESF
jgi:hypothetical protein